jgi:GH15 family glucan-1,4-alpha-glucosidase
MEQDSEEAAEMNLKKAERLYRSSVRILKKSQLRNGGCLATPRGERYPYIYPRDHSFCILGFLSAGMVKEAKRGLEFVFSEQLENGAFPQRYDIKGRDASYKPIQIDGTGLILHAFAKYVNQTGDSAFARDNWDRVKKAVNYVTGSIYQEKNLVFTPNSIHEFPPTEEGLEIWANCACCAALRELSGLAERLKLEHDRWRECSNSIKSGILKYMWNSRVESFIKNIRVRESSSVKVEADVSEYAVAYFGILPDKDKRVISTVERIEKELWSNEMGGICRYAKREGRHNGGYGPWPHFTLMICRHYISLGERKMADKYLNWVLKIAHKNELPEHISTRGEFEEYVTDFREAGILRKDRLIMIENARKHPMFRKGIAYITPTLSWPHAEFIMTWNLYNGRFLSK